MWKIGKKVLLTTVVICLIIVYGKFHPETSGVFPKCPFLSLTGYECPGCGSQRAIHYLLNGKIGSAFNANALLILFIPYILLGFIFDLFRFKNKTLLKIRRILYGTTAIWVVFSIVVLFWILRNCY